MVTQILKLAHFIDHHGVAQVQVGRGRVHTQLYVQRTPKFQFCDKLRLNQYFVRAATDDAHLFGDVRERRHCQILLYFVTLTRLRDGKKQFCRRFGF